MWADRQSSHRELCCMSACKIFLAVELLLWVKALYSRTAARNQLNCRGSRPHSGIKHQGALSLTISILLSTVISHFCKGLSISLPCRKNGVAQTWFAYIPAGIAHVLRRHMQMCNLFVRSCSCMNCVAVRKLGNAQTDTSYYTYYQNLIKNKSAHSKISSVFWSIPGISHKEKE